MIAKHHRNYGFTLIEVLVVVLVISILMGVVVNSLGGFDREQKFRGYAERLALRIEIGRDKALLANREWGVYLNEDGVKFAEFDEINRQWVIRSEKPFSSERYDAQVRFTIETEDLGRVLDELEDDQSATPDIVLFSSGETTPFEISVEPSLFESAAWQLHSDGFTRTQLSRDET